MGGNAGTSEHPTTVTAHGALPPYSASAGPSGSEAVGTQAESGDFFDIAPSNDSTSFQVGYLGLKGFDAWVKGDVLVKLDPETKRRGAYKKCTIQLHAIECVQHSDSDDEMVELFSHSYVLWEAAGPQAGTSSSSLSATIPPSAMPFSFPLTADLPHCVHLRHSSLQYQIVAKLLSTDSTQLPDAVKTIPVHLVRYTRPGPLDQFELAEIDNARLTDSEFSLQPRNWIEQSPTTAYIQINRSIFRRAEPIDIRVHIPPPHPNSMSEKGLKLRAVEADLVRLISVKRPLDSDSKGAVTNSSSALTVQEALLAHSGKLCRFHSQRPVLLRLTLHPPFDRANMPHPHPDHDALASGPVFGRGGGGGCESISQETLMHKVAFEVRIKIGMQGGHGERRDIICRKLVKILPGAAGALEGIDDVDIGQQSTPSEKEKLKQSDKAKATETEPTSSTDAVALDLLNFGMEDEYDGYEDVGHSLNDILDQVDGVDEQGSSSTHEERLEQLRQLLEQTDAHGHDDLPPSLLESQHDLQVEIELEGVGLAMPRHPADTYAPSAQDDYSSPPPPLIDDHTTPRDSSDPLSLPPPISAHERSHDSPPSHSDYDPPTASSGTAATPDSLVSTLPSGRHEPPPYLVGEAVPTFAQATRQRPNLSNETGTALPARTETHPAPDRSYARPPAYGTSPHPPSYDA